MERIHHKSKYYATVSLFKIDQPHQEAHQRDQFQAPKNLRMNLT